MHVKNPSQDLVDEVLDVLIRELLSGVDDSMHVCFHKVCDDVNVFEAVPPFVCLLNV